MSRTMTLPPGSPTFARYRIDKARRACDRFLITIFSQMLDRAVKAKRRVEPAKIEGLPPLPTRAKTY